MAATAHSHPNYLGIFWLLLGLTVVEVAITFFGLPKIVLGAILVVLAVWKASLVALHFMHLKFERKTLTIVALVPFILCVFLLLMLMPEMRTH